VIDTVGGDYGKRSARTLRPGGTLVSLVSPADDEIRQPAAERDIRTGFTRTRRTTGKIVLAIVDRRTARSIRPYK